MDDPTDTPGPGPADAAYDRDRTARADRIIRDLIEARGLDEMRPLADALAALCRASENGARPAAELGFVPFADLRAATPPEPRWVLAGYLARGEVTMLAGKPKAGKSTLACAIAEAVDADAATFLGRRVAGGPVAYVSEEGAGTLAPKLPGSRRSVALTRDRAWPKPRWADLIAAATRAAEETGAVLLVVDALSFWAGFAEGQEKDAGATQAVMDALVEATRVGLAILLVHHQRKAGGEEGDAVRGSGAIFGAVDALVELERLGDDAPPGQRRLVGISRWIDATPPALVVDRDAATGSWRVVGQAASRGETAALGYRERVLAAIPTEPPGATTADLIELTDLDGRKLNGPLRGLVEDAVVERTGRGVKGEPYRYRKCSPEYSPEAGGESPLKCSPPPIGGEHQHLYPSGFSPPGGESEADGGRTEDGDSLAADISDPSHGGEPEGTSPEEEEPIPDAVWRRPGETVEEAEARIDEVIDAILADGGSEVEDDEDGPRP